MDRVGAEHGGDERGEGLDVRAHHDDVARLERVVVGQEVEHRVAQHLDLPQPSVAVVDLDRAVVGGEDRLDPGPDRPGVAVVADVGLEALEEGRGAVGRGRGRGVVDDPRPGLGGDDQLDLADVAAPGAQQRVADRLGRRVAVARPTAAGRRGTARGPVARRGDALPQVA